MSLLKHCTERRERIKIQWYNTVNYKMLAVAAANVIKILVSSVKCVMIIRHSYYGKAIGG